MSSEVKKLADDRRDGGAKPRRRCWRTMPMTLAADPTKPHANPTPLKAVPKFDFGAAGRGGGDAEDKRQGL